MSTVRHMQGHTTGSRMNHKVGSKAGARRGYSDLDVKPRNKVEDIFTVIRQLNDVLKKENSALKKHQVENVRALEEKKTDLARLYQQQMNVIHRNPEVLKEMEEGKRNSLIQAGSHLTELMKENASLLRANIKVINTFLKTVVDAVRERQERRSTSYSEDVNLDGNTALKRNMAVSLNEIT